MLSWIHLRRSHWDDAKTALIMSQVGNKMGFQTVVDALQTTLVQETVVKSRDRQYWYDESFVARRV